MAIKNFIKFQFLSEKQEYKIDFDTTELSLNDVKSRIIEKRNMKKFPEKFELLFFDENFLSVKEENIKPYKKLFIKRIPYYKQHTNFKEVIIDPKDIPELETQPETLDPPVHFDSILSKLTKESVNKLFTCPSCKVTNMDLYLVKCCGESLCKKCTELNTAKCIFCGISNSSFIPNVRLHILRDKLLKALLDNKTFASSIIIQLDNPKEDSEEKKVNDVFEIKEDNKHFESCKFYIIKSSNQENILLSQDMEEWATTVQNQKKLNDAFQNHDLIILIFSINKSRQFQGFAVMKTFITDKSSSAWNNDGNVKLGGTFDIKWLCKCDLSFTRVTHLLNPINGEPVIKSRDTQELSKDIGVQLCNLCLEQEHEEVTFRTRTRCFNFFTDLPKLIHEIRINKESNFSIFTFRTRKSGESKRHHAEFSHYAS